jgi:hypothetical protein
MPVPQPAQPNAQCLPYLPYTLLAVLEATPGRDEVAHQRGRPQTHVIAEFPGTTADRRFDLRPLVHR